MKIKRLPIIRQVLKCDWEYTIGGTDFTIEPDEDDNIHHIYVTRAEPSYGTVYETILHITCEAAWGESEEKPVVEAIWDKFESKHVERKDGKVLTYYWYNKNYSAEGKDFTNFLKIRHGRCGMWQHCLCISLQTHGISSKTVGIYSIYAPNRAFFMIKRWALGTKMIIKEQYLWSDLDKKKLYGAKDGDCVNLEGVAGQGDNPEPPEIFRDHALVFYNNEIYDPSYGIGPYDYTEQGKLRYENMVIAGFTPLNPLTWRCSKNIKKERELYWTKPVDFK